MEHTEKSVNAYPWNFHFLTCFWISALKYLHLDQLADILFKMFNKWFLLCYFHIVYNVALVVVAYRFFKFWQLLFIYLYLAIYLFIYLAPLSSYLMWQRDLIQSVHWIMQNRMFHQNLATTVIKPEMFAPTTKLNDSKSPNPPQKIFWSCNMASALPNVSNLC